MTLVIALQDLQDHIPCASIISLISISIFSIRQSDIELQHNKTQISNNNGVAGAPTRNTKKRGSRGDLRSIDYQGWFWALPILWLYLFSFCYVLSQSLVKF